MSEVGVGIYNTVDISNYNNAFKLLNEGITELLTCYLVGNELKVRNKDFLINPFPKFLCF